MNRMTAFKKMFYESCFEQNIGHDTLDRFWLLAGRRFPSDERERISFLREIAECLGAYVEEPT